jgi:hypothetical protein
MAIAQEYSFDLYCRSSRQQSPAVLVNGEKIETVPKDSRLVRLFLLPDVRKLFSS